MRLSLACCAAAAAAPPHRRSAPRRCAAAAAVHAVRPAPARSSGPSSRVGSPYSSSARGRSCSTLRPASRGPGAEAAGAAQERLFEAAFRGDLAEARALLDSGAEDVNAEVEITADSPVGSRMAAQATMWWLNDAVARVLVPWNPQPGDKCHGYHPLDLGGDECPFWPLVAAAAAGQEPMVELLLQRGADLSSEPKYGLCSSTQGEHALLAAAVAGHTGVARLLLDAGVSPRTRVITDAPEDVYDWGHPALLIASAAGSLDVCQLLIERGARVNARTHGMNMAGKTALMVAAAEGHADVVRLLLASGANPNSRYRSGWRGHGPRPAPTISALHLAAQCGCEEAVQLLLDSGAAIDFKDENGKTVLMYAVRAGSLPIVRLLVDRGADVHARTLSPVAGIDIGVTAMYYAFIPEIEQFLISLGLKSKQSLGRQSIRKLEMGITPDSRLPADPHDRQQALRKNAAIEFLIALHHYELKAEKRRSGQQGTAP